MPTAQHLLIPNAFAADDAREYSHGLNHTARPGLPVPPGVGGGGSCENFPYIFKAARLGRSIRRAVDTGASALSCS